MIVPSVSNGAGYGLEVPAQFFATPARHRVGRRKLTERTTCLRSVNPRSLITRIGSLSNHPESARSRRKDRRKSTLLRTSPAPRLRRKDIHGKLRCSQTEYRCLRGTRSTRLCHTLRERWKRPNSTDTPWTRHRARSKHRWLCRGPRIPNSMNSMCCPIHW